MIHVFFWTNAILPSWTMKLTESCGELENNFMGPIDAPPPSVFINYYFQDDSSDKCTSEVSAIKKKPALHAIYILFRGFFF